MDRIYINFSSAAWGNKRLDKAVRGDLTIGSDNVVVGLLQHRVVVVEGEVLGQQLVRQLVDAEEGVKLLKTEKHFLDYFNSWCNS